MIVSNGMFLNVGFPSSYNTSRSQSRNHKENVAPERGASGLDDEYLFTHRSSRPHTRSSKETFFTDYDKKNQHLDDSETDDGRSESRSDF